MKIFPSEVIVSRTSSKYYLAAAIAVATFLLYLPALQNDFLSSWDDNVYVLQNPYIRTLDVSFLQWAFLDFYATNWHPLTWASHALDYALWGLNPLGHHLTNVILHAVNTFAVVFVVMGLIGAFTERARIIERSSFLNQRTILMTAGITGLLFGLHPVHVESVAWISERKDLLCALFFLLCISSYIKYIRSIKSRTPNETDLPRFFNKHYLVALVFFILALLSKPMAVTIPVVLLILDWYPFGRISHFKNSLSVFWEKVPFIALSLIASFLTILAQSERGMDSLELTPLSMRILVGSEALVAYLWKMIVPLHLSPFYPYPNTVSLFSFQYSSAVALVIGITITSIYLAKKQKLFLSVWSYYLVTLVPVLGIVQVGNQSMADRYTYLPSLGPFLIVALSVAWIVAKISLLKRGKHVVGAVCAIIIVSVLITMSYLSFQQIGVWKNNTVFWFYVIENEPKSIP